MNSRTLRLTALGLALLSTRAFAGDVLIVTDSGNDRVFRCVDLNNDGDFNDAGEVVDFYDDIAGAFVLSNNSGVVCVAGTTYISDSTEHIVLSLRDANNDGDALDSGEANIFFDGRPGGNADNVLMTSAASFAWDATSSSFFLATDNTGTAGSVDEILRLRDNNNDGDSNDLGEVTHWWTAPAGSVGDYIPTAVKVAPDGRVYYVENGSTGVTAKGVYTLGDNNNDGDAQDAGERLPFFIPPALTVSPQLWSIDQDADGWFYMADTGNDVIWRFKDLDNDGDANDPGEASQWYVVGAASNMWDICIGADGTVYATDAQSPQRLVALRDANHNGVIDAGEATVIYNSTISNVVIGTGRGIDVERPAAPGTAFCFGDGTGTACPCGNVGAAGNGCASSIFASGANLDAQGVASISADTLVLMGSAMPDSSALYFQGTMQQSGGQGAVFGDGLRCAGGTIVRLRTVLNASGQSSYPVAGDPSISVRGADSAGAVRTYQIWYRNAANFCTVSTFNLSNGVQVTWTP